MSMVTGDHMSVASKVCEEVGIPREECFARLLPHEKLNWIKTASSDGVPSHHHHQQQDFEHNHNGWCKWCNCCSSSSSSNSSGGSRLMDKDQDLSSKINPNRQVMMMGDGINDAAALAGATVGLAMGAGGTAMAAAAAEIVMMSDNLLRVPSTIRLCRYARDIIIQNCCISIAIKIAAVVLAVTGVLSFWEAVLVDVGTLLIVIFNGTRPLSSNVYQTNDQSQRIVVRVV